MFLNRLKIFLERFLPFEKDTFLKGFFKIRFNSIIETLFRILDFINILKPFSKIFSPPINKKIVCFGSMLGREFIDNPKYFFLYLNLNSNYICYWVTSSKILYKQLKNKGYNVIYNFSFKAIRILRSAGFIITAWGLTGDYIPISFSKKSVIIQTWHGSQFKKLLADIGFPLEGVNLYENYFLISPSKSVNKFLISAFQIKPNKIILTGFPRNDILYKADEGFKKLLKQKYNISEDFEKIILYAPTFREHELTAKFPLSNEDLKELNRWLQESNTLLINKSHFWNKQVSFREFKNILTINKFVDTQELIIISDMLITDYSTIFFDFVLMKKSVILFPYDLEEYLRYPGIYHKLEDIAVGPIVKTGWELIKALKTTSDWIQRYQEKMIKVRDEFWDFQDGKSCERLYQKLFESHLKS